MNRPQSETNAGAPMPAPDSKLARVVMRALLNKTDECREKCPGIGGDVDAMNLRAMLDRGEFDVSAVRQAHRGLLALAGSLDIEAGDECGAVDELLSDPRPAPTATERTLAEFGDWTLDVLAGQEEWNADTLDAIAGEAFDLNLVTHGENGRFTKTKHAPAPITLIEAIDCFEVLRDYRDGLATDGKRAWIDDANTFCNNAARRGSGAHRCAQFLASLAGFNIGQFNLANLLARVDSSHKSAAVGVFFRYMEASGF